MLVRKYAEIVKRVSYAQCAGIVSFLLLWGEEREETELVVVVWFNTIIRL